MCSIAGEVSFSYDLKDRMDIYRAMGESLQRRGPDDRGVYLKKDVCLIHNRLAVIDPQKGKQPMKVFYENSHYIICYNGEIYNTEEVRRELEEGGFAFHTTSDTEVVLKAYIGFGEACVEKLNGIFAFAIWNENKKELFLARDRIGVKPLFYGLNKGGIVFASEIKALLCHPDFEPIITEKSIAEIMLIGPGRTQKNGIFKNIYELPPATCAVFNEYGLRSKKYWSLQAKEHKESLEDTIAHTRFLVTDAIRRQLVSDVPLGTFLSGGLDSSLISSVANRYFEEQGKVLTTFSVDYRDNDKHFTASKFQPNSDNAYIEIMARFLGGDNRRIVLDTEQLTEALFAAVNARDLPGMADIDASMLLLCAAAKENATVVLSGECADEVFGGYPWYRDKTIRERYGFPWAQSTAYRASFLIEPYRSSMDAAEYVNAKYEATLKTVSRLEGEDATNARMREMMKLNLDWFMQTLLDRKDRMSMYSGLEVRVPFCDYRLVEYLYNVPWEYKDYNGYEKGLLRKAVEGYLPEQVLWRKKSPYPKTHNPNYLAAVSRKLQAILDEGTSPMFAFVDKKVLEDLLHSNNPVPWYGQLMTTPQTIAYFLQIDYWMRTYKVKIEG
ncbi:MAG: asparagine synthase (glutamine-hydrolyzing) [Clostridia bacterium]|nr:asparagine synthase (glutamine-hydrolyzing) [Clostridia bacterium]